MIGVDYVMWFSAVVIPFMAVTVPIVIAILKHVKSLEKINSEQHAAAMKQRSVSSIRLEEKIENVLVVATDTNRLAVDTNRKLDEHLRDHHVGNA